jgi:hypothetical protein
MELNAIHFTNPLFHCIQGNSKERERKILQHWKQWATYWSPTGIFEVVDLPMSFPLQQPTSPSTVLALWPCLSILKKSRRTWLHELLLNPTKLCNQTNRIRQNISQCKIECQDTLLHIMSEEFKRLRKPKIKWTKFSISEHTSTIATYLSFCVFNDTTYLKTISPAIWILSTIAFLLTCPFH